MKCPKCGYLGFERTDSCRNCGYDFSLTSAAPVPELPLRSDSHIATRGDDLDRLIGAPEDEAQRMPSSDLPLFVSTAPDDEPLIKAPLAPRAPLAVRRATPDMPRLRPENPRIQTLELGFDEPRAVQPAAAAADSERARGNKQAAAVPQVDAAGLVRRLVAVLVDVLILTTIDALVVYFTVQICGLSWEEVAILPKGPLVAFLVVQNGGYLVAFTAGGQTLGKMAAGIRVVSAEPHSSLDLGQAFLRELMWLVLAVPAGLGFLSALFTRDHRGLHDRFAGTRVVR